MTGGPVPSDVERLLERMRSDDREAAAIFVTRFGSRIRRRIRGKMSPSMRRIFDSQDILSTVGRRLDQFVRNGQLEAVSEEQLWSLIYRMANNAVVDKSRVVRRLRRVEDEDGPFAQELLRRLRRAQRTNTEEIEIEQALRLFDDPVDREILSMWLVGTPHGLTAEAVELTPAAVRQRWKRIRERLQERFSAENG